MAKKLRDKRGYGAGPFYSNATTSANVLKKIQAPGGLVLSLPAATAGYIIVCARAGSTSCRSAHVHAVAHPGESLLQVRCRWVRARENCTR